MLRQFLYRSKPVLSKQRYFSTPIYSTVHQPAKLGTSLSKYGVNLSKYAADGKLDPGISFCLLSCQRRGSQSMKCIFLIMHITLHWLCSYLFWFESSYVILHFILQSCILARNLVFDSISYTAAILKCTVWLTVSIVITVSMIITVTLVITISILSLYRLLHYFNYTHCINHNHCINYSHDQM